MNNCRLFNLHSEIVTRVEKVGVIKKKKTFIGETFVPFTHY